MSERFLTISASYIPRNECWLMISDYRWWSCNLNEIEEWCHSCLEKGLKTEGMIIKFSNSEEQNVFLMRWANE